MLLAVLRLPQLGVDQYRHRDWVNSNPAQIKQGVDVSAQQQAIIDHVGGIALIGHDVGSLQDIRHIAARHGATPAVRIKKDLTKGMLPAAPHDAGPHPSLGVLDIIGIKGPLLLSFTLRGLKRIHWVATQDKRCRVSPFIAHIVKNAFVAESVIVELLFLSAVEEQ